MLCAGCLFTFVLSCSSMFTLSLYKPLFAAASHMTLVLHTVSSDSNHCLHLLAISAHLFPLLPSSLLLPIFVSHPLFIHYGHMLQLLHCFLFTFQDQNRMFCIIPHFLIISDSRCPLCQYCSICLLENVPVPCL